MDIYEKLESVPEEAVKVSLAVGNERRKVAVVKAWDHIPEGSLLQEEMYIQGYGEDFKYARLYFKDGNGKPVKSLSFSGDNVAPDLSDNASLAKALVDMTRECRNWMENQQRFANEREEKNLQLLEMLMKAHSDLLTERTVAMSLELAAQQEEENAKRRKENEEAPWKGPAAMRLLQMGEMWMQNMFSGEQSQGVPPGVKEMFFPQVAKSSESDSSLEGEDKQQDDQ